MSVYRVGKYWHYSFQYLGVAYHASTRLAGTERNRTRALAMELKAKTMAREGNAHLLRLTPMPFNSAADQFIQWAQGEYREKPNTWKRLAGSCSVLKAFFKQKPVHLITDGDVENFKTWRRIEHQVREVTIRHDLHCLGPLFRFAMKHRWCMNNPVERVDIPSDAESHVMKTISPAEEAAYFAEAEKVSQDLADLGRLMILQGPRPWCEVTVARVEHIDLERGTWLIPKSKSNAGKRTLFLAPEAKSILARRIGAARNGNLFWDWKGKGVVTLNWYHGRARKACGLAFRIYDLRHEFASRFYRATKDIAALAAILGHRDLKSVMRYVHLSSEHQRTAMLLYSQGQEMADKVRVN